MQLGLSRVSFGGRRHVFHDAAAVCRVPLRVDGQLHDAGGLLHLSHVLAGARGRGGHLRLPGHLRGVCPGGEPQGTVSGPAPCYCPTPAGCDGGAAVDASAAVDAGGPCVTSADCGKNEACGYKQTDGCSAKGTCFASLGATCQLFEPGCACDGSSVNLACNGLPMGYTTKPLRAAGACAQ